MTNLDAFISHIRRLAESGSVGSDFSAALLLSAFIFNVKPARILQLGLGTGEFTVAAVHSLRMMNLAGLTCVDDWRAWQGREPEGVEQLRRAGVTIVAPVTFSNYIKTMADTAFRIILAKGRHIVEQDLLEDCLTICGPEGFLLLHGVDQIAQRQVDLIKKRIPGCSILHLNPGCVSQGVTLISLQERKNKNCSQAKIGTGGSNKSIYLGLVKGDGYGWGVCSRYLIQELSKKRTIHVLSESDGSASSPKLDGVLFQALTNIHLEPMFAEARGGRNIGYTFFENELTPQSVENAKKYDLVLGGSTWCRERLLEKGIKNCDVLIQGIDPDLFYPIETNPTPDRFVIFSGGKFELRKGQDLVLKAVKVLQDRYPDVWLVNCWYNLWPASTKLMGYSRHIRFEHHEGASWEQTMNRTYVENGLDVKRIITHQLLPQNKQRDLFAQTDIGVFPNRCEGGTNLVLMEYMACAKPVIASNTSGHKDIVTKDNALVLKDLSDFYVRDAGGTLIARWEEPSLDELIAQLEYAYHNRSAIQEVGCRAGHDLMRFTWQQSAGRLIDLIDELEESDRQDRWS